MDNAFIPIKHIPIGTNYRFQKEFVNIYVNKL